LQASGPMVLRPIMDPSVGFDPMKDFSPIALFGGAPNVVIGGAQLSARSVQEVVDWAKKIPAC
jgi:tripartite-type tricarboxylate transporter receptor subunit TctC